MKLDVGCGYTPRGDVNCDIKPTPYTDVICSAEALPFRDDCFDEVICKNVIEHCTHTSLVIEELRRVATRKIILITDNIHWIGKGFHYLLKRGVCVTETEHCHAWTKFYLRNFLNRFGFRRFKITNEFFKTANNSGWQKRWFDRLIARPLSAMRHKPALKAEIWL